MSITVQEVNEPNAEAIEPIDANRITAINKPTNPTGKYLVTNDKKM